MNNIDFEILNINNNDLADALNNLFFTASGTQSLNRDLGIDNVFLDCPVLVAQEKYRQELYVKLDRYFPSLKIKSIDFQANSEGTILVKVVVK